LKRFPTISSGAGAKAPFIYVNYHQLSPPRKVKMGAEAYKWISSFEA
jgi:predicted DNA-binding transcriptional regulator AlpA